MSRGGHIFLIIAYFLSFVSGCNAQIFPIENSNWSHVGIQINDEEHLAGEQLLEVSQITREDSIRHKFNDENYIEYNFVEDFEGDNSGSFDNSQLLEYAIQFTPENSIIYFPPGEYLFKRPITFKSGHKVLKGRSPNTTFLNFDLEGRNNNLISAVGLSDEKSFFIDSIGSIGANIIYLSTEHDYQPGDFIEIERENDPKIITKERSWSQWAIGDIYKIENVEGEKIYVERNFVFPYHHSSYRTRIKKVDLIESIGFENFSIIRKDNGYGNTFNATYARNIYLKCINSRSPSKNHVVLTKVINSVVYGCYFNGSQNLCGGGTGYGVWLSSHSSNILVENNVFRLLRHAIILSLGANQNVIANNYSRETIGTSGSISEGGCTPPEFRQYSDISLHGNYPHTNLFEQNVAFFIYIDDTWGPSGPNNVFLRNKVYSKPHSRNLSGFRITGKSENQVLLGNEITFDKILADSTLQIVTQYGNLENSSYDKHPTNEIPKSLYLENKPNYYANLGWPGIGPNAEKLMYSNPAEMRWENDKVFDKYCCGDVPGLSSNIHYYDDILIFFDDGVLYIESSRNFNTSIMLIDASGRTIYKNESVQMNNPILLGKNIADGVYLLSMVVEGEKKTIKVIFENK